MSGGIAAFRQACGWKCHFGGMVPAGMYDFVPAVITDAAGDRGTCGEQGTFLGGLGGLLSLSPCPTSDLF